MKFISLKFHFEFFSKIWYIYLDPHEVDLLKHPIIHGSIPNGLAAIQKSTGDGCDELLPAAINASQHWMGEVTAFLDQYIPSSYNRII